MAPGDEGSESLAGLRGGDAVLYVCVGIGVWVSVYLISKDTTTTTAPHKTQNVPARPEAQVGQAVQRALLLLRLRQEGLEEGAPPVDKRRGVLCVYGVCGRLVRLVDAGGANRPFIPHK